jgi:hypothetical protein
MGMFCASSHFKTDDTKALRDAVDAIARLVDVRALIAPPKNGWTALYPSAEGPMPQLLLRVAKLAGIEHAIGFVVHDSDRLQYWYVRSGGLEDEFVSCPDYFGTGPDEDFDAVGNPDAFETLLDLPKRRELQKLLGSRTIAGEETGSGLSFDFEEERLLRIAEVLGIHGVLGSYDQLVNGQEIEGVGSAKQMIEVG